MKKVLLNKLLFSFLIILLLFPGCYKQEGELILLEPDEELLVQLFRPVPGEVDISSPHYLQMTLRQDRFQLSFFGNFSEPGYPGPARSIYLADTGAATEAVLLLDENGLPAFLYGIDVQRGTKTGGVAEFEPAGEGRFFLRFYHYDWVSRLGTLLLENRVEQRSDGFAGNLTFITENLELDGIIKTGKKGNRTFGAPLPRLESLLGRREVTFRDDPYSALEESVGRLPNPVTDFLFGNAQQIAQNGVKAWVIALAEGAGLPTGGPPTALADFLAEFGTVVATAGSALDLRREKDRLGRTFGKIRDRIDDFGTDRFSHGADVVETFNGYAHGRSLTWNDISSRFDRLDGLLTRLVEEKMLISAAELDDLPTAEGVIQVALNWSTRFTDVDLWVTDPHGERIYFENPNSTSEGYLDRDDTDGYGPENIFWRGNAPDGRYVVEVQYFGCDLPTCPVTSYTVKISNGLGHVTTESGILRGVGQVFQAAVFTKRGTVIE